MVTVLTFGINFGKGIRRNVSIDYHQTTKGFLRKTQNRPDPFDPNYRLICKYTLSCLYCLFTQKKVGIRSSPRTDYLLSKNKHRLYNIGYHYVKRVSL